MVRCATLLTAILMVLSSPAACDKYDVPASGDRGDSAGDSQPCADAMLCPTQQCQPGQIKVVPVDYRVPEVYNYAIFVEVENADCETMNFKDEMAIDRVGSYGNPEKFVVFDDGKSGIVKAPSPYRTGFVIEKAKPHHLSIEASIVVTPAMVRAEVAWLTCRIERDAKLVSGLGQVGLARVALTGTGIHTVICVVLT